ncbi:MAG TPA: glycosyltransferase family 39 protein [Verrucomicrobiae bacterium]|nr:glycosyltransferase family 39 protein [Verrucomicrobiae bacterium]
MNRNASIAAAATFLVHLIANPHYGFFRDELYFIVCGFHPAWGYVDQPPVVPLLAAATQLFGHSLVLLRAVPALFAAASVYVTFQLAAELGGGTFAQCFAGLVAALTPVLMSFGSKATTDEVGLWLWPLAALYVLRIANGASPRWWLAAGVATGAGIESKYSMLFFVAALLAGLLVGSRRRVLASWWFAAGALAALAIVLPNFMWQLGNGFPMVTLLEHANEYRNIPLGPGQYAISQILLTNPLLAPFWLIGLVALLRRSDARFLGIAYVLLIAQMIVLHGKHYYPGDVYPIPIAAGAVAIEAWSARRGVVRAALAVYAAAAGAVLIPLVMPVLPEPALIACAAQARRLFAPEVTIARGVRSQLGVLPPDFADMHGWPRLAATVARVYDSLPPSQRAQTAIIAKNYGEASAIDFFGPRYGLPQALSGENQYWIWGTHAYTGSIVIDVDGTCDAGSASFRYRRVAAHFDDPWAMPFENGAPISICEGLSEPLAAYWPNARNYL